MSLYLREASELHHKGIKTVSSSKLADLLGLSDAQVRKDFTYFGQFGHRGVGYHVGVLIRELKRILGTDRMWDVVLIGCGNLGRALVSYTGFKRQGFQIVGVFDTAGAKIGTRVGDLTVQPMSDLSLDGRAHRLAHRDHCVPPRPAQKVADQLVAVGIRGILNFAAVSIVVPSNVVEMSSVDLAVRLENSASS